MAKSVLCCLSILALVAAAAAAGAAETDCESRIEKLDASDAEGADRLLEKNAVIDHCASQYKRDKTIQRLVNDCAKYEEQPVVKRQLVAECQLSAFRYANALRTLKAEYRK